MLVEFPCTVCNTVSVSLTSVFCSFSVGKPSNVVFMCRSKIEIFEIFLLWFVVLLERLYCMLYKCAHWYFHLIAQASSSFIVQCLLSSVTDLLHYIQYKMNCQEFGQIIQIIWHSRCIMTEYYIHSSLFLSHLIYASALFQNKTENSSSIFGKSSPFVFSIIF